MCLRAAGPAWSGSFFMQSHSFDMVFRLYTRSYCHLCEDMLNALMRLKPRHRFDIDLIDVDLDAKLVERYDEMVPVLTAQADPAMDEVYLCHYHFDMGRVLRFLQERR